jgi:protein tyrosine phosphatase (PTP) superfamily phosphohydrolase (DUF442 family)
MLFPSPTPLRPLGRFALGGVLIALGLGSCAGNLGQASLPTTARPLTDIRDAFESASEVQLPAQDPINESGLQNAFRLSENVYSGGEPDSEEAFARLKQWGVKTVISVDGKAPEVETAARHDLRYVHLPLHYKGIEDEILGRLVKTFREMPGPFYVHCFHGRHRGPAAAAVGRLVLDGASRETALAEMRQWCGTSSAYSGLYDSIARAELPSVEQSAKLDWDFPGRHHVRALRASMADLARSLDDLTLSEEQRWVPSAAHPDLEPARAAGHMVELLQGLALLEEVRGWNSDQRQWIDNCLDAARNLSQAISAQKAQIGAFDFFLGEPIETAEDALNRLSDNCIACHRANRNR